MADFETFDLGDTLKNVETMKYLQSRTANDNMESNLKLQDYAGRLASGLVNEMAKTGIPQGTPEFQKKLDELAPPYRQQFQAMGIPVKDGPVSWEHLNALANNAKPANVHATIPVADGKGGAKYFNVLSNNTVSPLNLDVPTKNVPQGVSVVRGEDGTLKASVIPGITDSLSTTEAAKQLGRERERVVEAENDQRQKIFLRAGKAAGGGGNQNPLPTPAQAMPQQPLTQGGVTSDFSGGDGGDQFFARVQKLSLSPQLTEKMIKTYSQLSPEQQAKMAGFSDYQLQTALDVTARLPNPVNGLRGMIDHMQQLQGLRQPQSTGQGVAVPDGRNPNTPAFGPTQAQIDEREIQKEAVKAEIAKQKEMEVAQAKQKIEMQGKIDSKNMEIVNNAKKTLDLLGGGLPDEKGNIQKIEDVIKKSTGSSLGAMADSVMRSVGIDTDAMQAATQLEMLAAEITQMIDRQPGAQSDAELLGYKQQVGDLGNRSKTAGEKLAAYRYLIANKSRILEKLGQTPQTPSDTQQNTPNDSALSPNERQRLKFLREHFKGMNPQ